MVAQEEEWGVGGDAQIRPGKIATTMDCWCRTGHTQQMSSKGKCVSSFRTQLERGLQCRLWSHTDMVGLLRQSFLPYVDWTKLPNIFESFSYL